MFNTSAYGNPGTFRFPPGAYTAKQFVNELTPLFDSILVQLGQDSPGTQPARKTLVDGLRSCLSIDERESSLRIGKGSDGIDSPAREEIARQAVKIGSLIVRYVNEAQPSTKGNPQLYIRSPCKGHTWRFDVSSLLFGPRSDRNIMQLYNEWLHQLVLLRDALLPFENFQDVRLTLRPEDAPGSRPLEPVRPLFNSQIITGKIKQGTLIEVAKIFTAPGLPSGGNGFQFAGGSVMPVSSVDKGSTSVLLKYAPPNDGNQ